MRLRDGASSRTCSQSPLHHVHHRAYPLRRWQRRPMIGQEKARLDSTALDCEPVAPIQKHPLRLYITGFPFPPSENALYYNMPRKGRVLSTIGRDYMKRCEIWALANAEIVRVAVAEIRRVPMRVRAFLCCKHERIYTKKGEVKRFDPSNYEKALYDNLSRILHVDDRYFFSTAIEKCEIDSGEECAMIEIKETIPRRIGVDDANGFMEFCTELDNLELPESL